MFDQSNSNKNFLPQIGNPYDKSDPHSIPPLLKARIEQTGKAFFKNK